MRKILCLLSLLLPLSVFSQTQEDSILSPPDTSRNVLVCYFPATIQPRRATMIGIGTTEFLDTYLSAEKHCGTELRFLSHSTRTTRWRRVSQVLIHQGQVATAHNRADNGREIGGLYNLQYALRYNWLRYVGGGTLFVDAGGGGDLNLGFLYNTRNGNNPAQARASLNIGPSASATYVFRLHKAPMRLRYGVQLPLVGIMFSPNYGQSYYEIFNKGNYDHNIVLTTIASTPSFRHLLSLDFKVGRTFLRLGYLGDYQQAKVNGLKYHQYSHLLMIGLVRTLSSK